MEDLPQKQKRKEKEKKGNSAFSFGSAFVCRFVCIVSKVDNFV